MSAEAESEKAPDLRIYRTLGPFTEDTLPKGLLKQHRLRAGSWARLTILSGAIDFVWDDGDRETERLATGMTKLVEPLVPHHIALTGPVELEVAFLERKGA